MSSGAIRLDLCPTLSLFVRLSLVKLGGHLFSIVLKSSSPATQGLCRKYHQFSFKTLNFQLGLKMAFSCPVVSSIKTLFPNLLYFHISEKKKKKKKFTKFSLDWESICRSFIRIYLFKKSKLGLLLIGRKKQVEVY